MSTYAREMAVPCDYCEEPAERIISSAAKENRIIVCGAHAERGRNAQEPVSGYPYVRIVDPPLPGRDRFVHLEVDDIVARMRRALAGAKP